MNGSHSHRLCIMLLFSNTWVLLVEVWQSDNNFGSFQSLLSRGSFEVHGMLILVECWFSKMKFTLRTSLGVPTCLDKSQGSSKICEMQGKNQRIYAFGLIIACSYLFICFMLHVFIAPTQMSGQVYFVGSNSVEKRTCLEKYHEIEQKSRKSFGGKSPNHGPCGVTGVLVKWQNWLSEVSVYACWFLQTILRKI